MLKRWPAILIGVVTGAAVLIQLLLVFFLLVLPPAVVKLLLPSEKVRAACGRGMNRAGRIWGHTLNLIFTSLHAPRWQVTEIGDLSPDKSYLLICNHQGWADIILLAALIRDRVPFFRFFIKREMLWVPVIGFACWAMDCPFMRRPTREQIRRQPELARLDLESTREACEKLRGLPVTMVNYVEGTRFTTEKQAKQQSPFRHLLKPRYGGLAYAMESMGDQFAALVDCTLIYPPGVKPHLWNFLSGRLDPVQIDFRLHAIPPDLLDGDYGNDANFRQQFQDWVNQIWQDKDDWIESVQNPTRSSLQT